MGMLTDLFIGMFIVTFIGTALFAMTYSSHQFLNAVAKLPGANQTIGNTGIKPINMGIQVQSNFYAFNEFIPIIFFGLNIIAILLAAFLTPNPLNIVTGVILIIFMPIVSIIMSNATRVIFLQPILLSTAQQFPQILTIAAQYPLYTIVFGLAYVVVLAVRSKQFRGNTEVQNGYGGAY